LLPTPFASLLKKKKGFKAFLFDKFLFGGERERERERGERRKEIGK